MKLITCEFEGTVLNVKSLHMIVLLGSQFTVFDGSGSLRIVIFDQNVLE